MTGEFFCPMSLSPSMDWCVLQGDQHRRKLPIISLPNEQLTICFIPILIKRKLTLKYYFIRIIQLPIPLAEENWLRALDVVRRREVNFISPFLFLARKIFFPQPILVNYYA